jgi:hypothetical protein
MIWSRGAEEQRSRGAGGQMSRGAEEQRSRGAEEQRSRGAEEQGGRGGGDTGRDALQFRMSNFEFDKSEIRNPQSEIRKRGPWPSG